MALLTLQYCDSSDDVFEVSYNDGTHAVITGSITGSFASCPDPKVDGDIIYTQPVTGGTYNVIAQPGSWPYARAVFVSSGGCVATLSKIVNTIKESSPGAADGQLTGTLYTPSSGVEFRITSPSVGSWQSSPVFSGLTSGMYGIQIRIASGCLGKTSFGLVELISGISATFEKTNTTTEGGNDGTITITASGGSGNYSYAWDDVGTNTATRTGLSAGLYSVTITDTQSGQTYRLEDIQISDPVVVEVDPYFNVPQMNSIRFVKTEAVDGCDIKKTMDNQLFCQSTHPYFNTLRYHQRFQKCDQPTIQFRSSVESHTILVKEYKTGNQQYSYTPELKVQNIGIVETFSISLEDNGDSRTRVYFTAGGPLPLPIEEGDAFEITSNSEGMNGLYIITSIGTDIALSTQYLIIETAYSGAGVSSMADGSFDASDRAYNIYEFVADFSSSLLTEGVYYIEINASSSDGFSEQWISEPIDIRIRHSDTNMVEWTNFDNAFGIDYSTEIKHLVRVVSSDFERLPGGESVTLRNTDGRLVTLQSKAFRMFRFRVFDLPPYMHEILSVAFRHDSPYINGQEVVANGQYEEPEYVPRHGLSNSNIILELKTWFDTYNSDDLGGVDQVDEGKIIANEGFLLR